MNRPSRKSDAQLAKTNTPDGTRETVESIVIAIILAFLFRAFEAEAFVIPTGSMAPTLQGRHMDIFCEQCGHEYRAGASDENLENRPEVRDLVTSTYCPICRFKMNMNRREVSRLSDREIRELELDDTVDKPIDPNRGSFMGDRILVCKFVYDLSEPRRWDVIVFKFPGNAQQNYIKRLIGLPGEAITIQHGDIYVQKKGEAHHTIARKPPYKVKAMLQLVDDTNHIGQKLIDAGWPSRWQQWAHNDLSKREWKMEYVGTKQKFQVAPSSGKTAWLRYRHLVPQWSDDRTSRANPVLDDDWDYILKDKPVPGLFKDDGSVNREGQLICDYYAYNYRKQQKNVRYDQFNHMGNHWVGDLGMECDLKVESKTGTLTLSLVEGGVEYLCQIDVATGEAKLLFNRGNEKSPGKFLDGAEQRVSLKPTRVKGPGTYHLRFTNVDDELLLWVNENVVKFGKTTIYDPDGNDFPVWSAYVGDGTERNPTDAEPVGIGSDGVALTVNRLRVLRDVYYVAASNPQMMEHRDPESMIDRNALDETGAAKVEDARAIMKNPRRWEADAEFFARRDVFEFSALGDDQFLPFGDNSPSSSDGRYWGAVDRRLLTGKALFIYWPHEWRSPLPITPNFSQRFIR